MTVTEACDHGNYRDVLRALLWRTSVTAQDPSTRGPALVALAKVVADLAEKLAHLDELAEADRNVKLRLVDPEPWDASTI